jgi:3-oxoacyl-[acyl-carrier protein] reductase
VRSEVAQTLSPSLRSGPGLVLVTGSSSGIGLATAQRMLELGWQVEGWDRNAAPIMHANFKAVQIDLMDAQALSERLQALTSQSFTAFVHAAGQMHTDSLTQLSLADGAAMWRLHVQVATQIAQALSPAMQHARSGRIVLLGSRVANGMAQRSQYAAVKAALIALARSWAQELASVGVTVNVVSPAATQTAMLGDPSRSSSKPKLPPIGRYIEPAEVASLIAYLLSSEAAAITGQNLQICGGSSL